MLIGDPRGRDDYVSEHHGDTEDNCLMMNDRSMQALDGILFIAEHKKKDEESTKVMMIAIIIIIIIIVIVIIIFIILNCHHDHNCQDPQIQNHEDLKNMAAVIDPLCSSVNHSIIIVTTVAFIIIVILIFVSVIIMITITR